MIQNKDFEIRNIINHEVVDQFLKLLIIKWSNLAGYINSNIKNYCYEYAPIRIANQKEIEFYKLPKKKTQYHIIILTESLMNSYMECLSFVIENKKNFVNKSFFEVYNLYNCDQGFDTVLKILKFEGNVTCLKEFSDGSQLVMLRDKQSFINESYRMNSCVHTYCESNGRKILSYRKNGKSIITIELKDGKIRQCRLRYNQEVNLEKFPELYAWIKNPENEWFYNESVDNIHNNQNKQVFKEERSRFINEEERSRFINKLEAEITNVKENEDTDSNIMFVLKILSVLSGLVICAFFTKFIL